MRSAHGCQEINLHYILFIRSFFFFYFRFLFAEHIFAVTSLLFNLLFSSCFHFIFNQYLPILLMFTNIISFPHHRPFATRRLAISCNCSEDKSQRLCNRNAIFCYSERYARDFIGYSKITVVGNCIREKAHDKLANVSRCSDLYASRLSEENGNTRNLSR